MAVKRSAPEPATKKLRTVSIALPSSVIAHAITYEQKTMLVGHIARAVAVYGVSEVVVYEDSEKSGGEFSSEVEFFCRNLEYLETPPYLKKILFPYNPNLKFAGLAPPLDCMHHLRKHEWARFREGVVLEDGVSVEVGLIRPATLPTPLEPMTRVTFEFDRDVTASSERFTGKAVSWEKVITETRKYDSWGFSVRAAQSLAAAMEGDYDLKIGIKDRDAIAARKISSKLQGDLLPKASKVLLVFASEQQPLPKEGLNLEVNVAEYSQSRAVRVEEAIWMALTSLRPSFLSWLRKP